MCDCVSSPPITYPGVRTRKLGFIRCNLTSRPSISRIELFRTIIGYRNLAKPLTNFQNPDGFKLSCRKVRSEKYDLFDELGFDEEKPKKVSENETRKKSSLDEEELKKIPVNSTPEDAAEISFINEKKEENRSGGEFSGSSSIDFLELEKEKKSRGNLESLEDDEIVRVEGSDKVGEFVGRIGLRSGRQMMRRSNMLAKQVISVQSAISLGFVSQLWVDTSSWVVLVVEVRPSLLSGEIERFLLEEVYQVGDVVLVEDESVMENGIQMIGLDTLVGYNVITPSRRKIGKVRGYTFNINSGSLELLELDSFGISIIPSSLVSTYALFVEDVIEVASDTVVVHEEAASCLQRLTKGFWDTPNAVETSKDKFGEYSDFEKQPARSDYGGRSRHKSFRNKKFPSKMKMSEDELDLPMDYL